MVGRGPSNVLVLLKGMPIDVRASPQENTSPQENMGDKQQRSVGWREKGVFCKMSPYLRPVLHTEQIHDNLDDQDPKYYVAAPVIDVIQTPTTRSHCDNGGAFFPLSCFWLCVVVLQGGVNVDRPYFDSALTVVPKIKAVRPPTCIPR